jgi:two-component system chemotaxis response regulator CheB
MPPLFTQMLAQRLDGMTDLSVREAKAGDVFRPGVVLVAPGDHHLVFERRQQQVVALLSQDPPENSCRPAVDVMFRSLADCFGASLTTVVLTGMGADGAVGVRAAREAGGYCMVQDEATSIVWGMPGAVSQAGLADQVLPLDQIGGALRRLTVGTARFTTRPMAAMGGHRS